MPLLHRCLIQLSKDVILIFISQEFFTKPQCAIAVSYPGPIGVQ